MKIFIVIITSVKIMNHKINNSCIKKAEKKEKNSLV